MNVSNRSSETAPKSLSVYKAESSPPAAAAGHSRGRSCDGRTATVRRQGCGPPHRMRVDLGQHGSHRKDHIRKALTRLSTAHAGAKPCSHGKAANHV